MYKWIASSREQYRHVDGVCELVAEGEGLGMDSGSMVLKTYKKVPQSLQEVAQSRDTYASPQWPK